MTPYTTATMSAESQTESKFRLRTLDFLTHEHHGLVRERFHELGNGALVEILVDCGRISHWSRHGSVGRSTTRAYAMPQIPASAHL